MSPKVNLQKVSSRKKTPSASQFQKWLDQTLSFFPKKLSRQFTELTVRIVGRTESTQYNERYLRKKGPTNVISFYYAKDFKQRFGNLGDLIMCAAVIEKEAKEQRKSLRAHWAHLTIHGILHLLGYNHVKLSDARIMEGLEIIILDQLGFKNPY